MSGVAYLIDLELNERAEMVPDEAPPREILSARMRGVRMEALKEGDVDFAFDGSQVVTIRFEQLIVGPCALPAGTWAGIYVQRP